MNLLKTQVARLVLFAILLIPFKLLAQEYPIFLTDQGYIIIEVKINDSISSNFILDTGGGAIVFSSKTFNKVKHSAVKAGHFTGFRHDGDRLDGEVYELPSIAIGNTKMDNPLVGVYPPLDDYGVEGLLSLKFFEDKPFTIDFVNSKIRIFSQDETIALSKNDIVLPMSFGIHGNTSLDIFIPIRLNDHTTIHAEFDTGSGYTTFLVNPYFIDELDLDRQQAKVMPYTTPLSQKKLTDSIFSLEKVTFGTKKNRMVNNDISASFREGLIYEGLIGSGLFKNNQITIDIPNKQFIVHYKE